MDISKIQIGSGIYNIKDEIARNKLLTINKYFLNKKFLLIGDSYGDGYTPDGNVTSWQSIFVTLTGLTNTIQKHQGGAGFVNLGSNKNFQTLLEEVTSSNDITDVVVLGGYNDTSYSRTQIDNAINSFQLKAIEKFPNANIHIGFIGWSNISTNLYPLYETFQKYSSIAPQHNCNYLTGIELSLHRYFAVFSSDGIHPNGDGQYQIATYLIQCLQNGSCNVCEPFTQIHLNYNNINGDPFSTYLTCVMIGHNMMFSLSGERFITFSSTFNLSAQVNVIELGDISAGYIIGTNYNILSIPIGCIIHSSEGYFPVQATLEIRNKKMYIRLVDINDTRNNFRSFTNVSQIEILPFSTIFESLYC